MIINISAKNRLFQHCYSTVVVQSLSQVQLLATPWTAAHQVSLSFTISQSLLKLMSIESVMLLNHLILCCPLLLLPSIFPSIWVFSNESALCIRWPKYCYSIVNENYMWSQRLRFKDSSEKTQGSYFGFTMKRYLNLGKLLNLAKNHL